MKDFVEAIDGFLLGNGNLSVNPSSDIARAQCCAEFREICKFFISHFSNHNPLVEQCKSASTKSGIVWNGTTSFHPDFYKQYHRWYAGGVKQPPSDICITPKSAMMWYLGDGAIVHAHKTTMVRLSTNKFSDERVEFLAERLRSIGIVCDRSDDNEIEIHARLALPAFFDFIGKGSPLSTYNYKFGLPAWMAEPQRMEEVAEDLGVCHTRMIHLVKTGRLKCYIDSEKDMTRMLRPEHVRQAEELIKAGELH